MKAIQVQLPDSLFLKPGTTVADLQNRSQFLLALKFFELAELSSGQAAQMCGMKSHGVPLRSQPPRGCIGGSFSGSDGR
jgi:hypothetical protein